MAALIGLVGLFRSCLVNGLYLLLLLFLLTVSGCKPSVMYRPSGYLTVGRLADLSDTTELFLEDKRLFLRKDDKGFYVMSTLCTSDLSPLKLASKDGQMIFLSDYTTSSYTKDGKVITGPAKHDLPYYELEFASSKVGGTNDTLYVVIGREVSANWRLQLPTLTQR